MTASSSTPPPSAHPAGAEPPDRHDPAAMVAGLVRLLTLSPGGADQLRGSPQPGGVGRVFGGQVVAQALQAAQACVPGDKIAHSLHAYFLRGGTEGVMTDYAVARDLDGRSFANRRVLATQAGEAILSLTASFQLPEDGLSHAEAPMPDVPGPEDLIPDTARREALASSAGDRMNEAQRAMMLRPRPIEMRSVGKLHWMNTGPESPRVCSWFRTVAPLPDDSALHRAVIAYASDFNMMGTAALAHGLSWIRSEITGASLDHAVWFHRPARADEWLLYATHSPWTGGGRGFIRGQIFDRAGGLVASVTQEAMLRRRLPLG